MPRNPSFNTGTDSSNNGLSHDMKGVNPSNSVVRDSNSFNLSYEHATTERYADVSPFYVLQCVPGDTIKFGNRHDINAYTMQAPLKDKIHKKKFYTLVPMKAILPNTWEVFFTNPTKGDDVPNDTYCSIRLLSSFESMWRRAIDGDLNVNDMVRLLFATESVFSTGALPAKLKCNIWSYLYRDKSHNFDDLFDTFINESNFFKLSSISVEVQPNESITFVADPEERDVSANYDNILNKHTYLDYIRGGASMFFDDDSEFYPDFLDKLTVIFEEIVGLFDETTIHGYPSKLDISRFVAYQISCVSQVTDTSIDYIFNADLYRNTLFGYINPDTFSYNGRRYLYDVFSEHCYNEMNRETNDLWFSYIRDLFTYRQSLKFGDYFTTARPQKLANGDINVDVRNNSVNSLEQIQKLVYTRFLNWNNRVGPKFDDYMKSMYGELPMPSDDEAGYINISSSLVNGYTVENTGSDQRSAQSLTTIINSQDGSFEFDVHISNHSILLGFSVYDIARLYTRNIDREYFKENRHDFFNPLLQNVGDQDIMAYELDARLNGDNPIAYTTRDMHHKTAVSHASGGFIKNLPAWAFTTEMDSFEEMYYGINPQFIRNSNGSVDDFFGSLSGYSLGNYFHWILRYDNSVEAVRPMEIAPKIL